jgi:uncharacterized membrane protein YbhN (UPF0104 family)
MGVFFLKMGSLPLKILPFYPSQLVQALYLKRCYDFPIHVGATGIAFSLILNLLTLPLFIIAGVTYSLSKHGMFPPALRSVIFPLFIATIVPFFIFCFMKWKKFQNAVIFYASRINTHMSDMFVDLTRVYSSLNIKKIIYLWFYSVVFMASEIIICIILAKSLHIHIPFYVIIYSIPIAIMATKLPLTIMGLGIRESSLLVLFA